MIKNGNSRHDLKMHSIVRTYNIVGTEKYVLKSDKF